MKTINCAHCNTDLIYLDEGRIKKGTICLCAKCWRMYLSAYNLNKTKPKMDLPEGFENIFGRFV